MNQNKTDCTHCVTSESPTPASSTDKLVSVSDVIQALDYLIYTDRLKYPDVFNAIDALPKFPHSGA